MELRKKDFFGGHSDINMWLGQNEYRRKLPMEYIIYKMVKCLSQTTATCANGWTVGMALGRVLGLRLRVPLASLGQVRGLDSDWDDGGDGVDNAWKMIFKMLWKQESEGQCQGPTPEWTTSRAPCQGDLLICLEIEKQDTTLNKKHRNAFHQSE